VKRAVAGALLLTLARGALSAPPPSPVEIKVEVTEIDQTKAARLGVEWPGTVTFAEKAGTSIGVAAAQRVTRLQADVDLLMQEGAARLLANPNLVTDSGTPASFHAGGEIPYVTNTSLGASHVEFKPYGVLVTAHPEVLADGRIRLKVKASVSSPDQANGTSVNGTAVPALREREVTSNVTLQAGATLMLAGLMQDERERVDGGVPVLRRIPLLGALFRWKRTNERRTSIIVFVTPNVVPL
jgi:pilus assembly protein CpaC